MANRSLAELTLNGARSRIIGTDLATIFEKEEAIDLVVCDENTATIPVPGMERFSRIVVPAGERCKQRDVLFGVIDAFAASNLTRDATVLAFGGGALTDLVAFAASIYLRGIRVILVPTSLLAMVDAAIGGKTGIDYGGYKNIVGSFAPAAEVRICTGILDTLPDREFRSGLAEALKAGFLGDAELVSLFETETDAVLRRDQGVLAEVIERAVRVKADAVQNDFTEQGQRAFLNLGHTFGHALESVLGLGVWTHGEAVAWGIARAMYAGTELGVTDSAWATRVTELLKRYRYEVGPAPAEGGRIVEAMHHDKKRTEEGIRFVLQRGPQETFLQTLVTTEILDILQ